MQRILSTGDPEKDAKLVAEALGPTNPRTKEEDKEKLRKANEEQATQNRNALVDTPHNEGEVLLVLPDDEEETHDDAKKQPEGQARVITSPAAPAVVQQTISQPEKKVS